MESALFSRDWQGTTINIDVQKMQIASYPIIYLQQQETEYHPEG